MSEPTVTEYDSDDGKKWKIHMPFEMDFSVEYFEEVAAAHEAGDTIEGLRITLSPSAYDLLPPDLARRLATIVVRGA